MSGNGTSGRKDVTVGIEGGKDDRRRTTERRDDNIVVSDEHRRPRERKCRRRRNEIASAFRNGSRRRRNVRGGDNGAEKHDGEGDDGEIDRVGREDEDDVVSGGVDEGGGAAVPKDELAEVLQVIEPSKNKEKTCGEEIAKGFRN
ncbi:unnamed protein product [Brassica oleracea var. botrytis]